MKILVFLAPGFEEIEALTVVDYLRRAEQNVITVSVPENGSTEISSVVDGSHGITVITDMVLKDLEEELEGNLPDAIYFPGGMPGAANLAANEYLIKLVRDMQNAGKLVAAMCASPAVFLSKTGILAGRNWTCYPGMNANIAEYCGSESVAAELNKGNAHIAYVPFVYDRNLLTGRGPGTAEQFAMKFVEIAAGSEAAQKIHDGSCQR